jgi:TetR/AcrR family transcriptional regulator, regulator of autoinduction and epiphytic fitness
MSDTRTASVDGRAARGERARAGVIDALLDLLTEGVVKPTAAQIAARAGVSLRLVFHHFSDLEAIHAEAADRQIERLRPLMSAIAPTLPIGEKLTEFVRARARLFEQISPVRRATIRLEPFSPELQRRLAYAHDQVRDQTMRAFGPELAAAPRAERAELAAALDAATSWESWNFMRQRERLPEAQARKVMTRTIRALLGAR